MDHSRSLEVALFDRLHTTSYSSSTVTIVIACIIQEKKRDIRRKL